VKNNNRKDKGNSASKSEEITRNTRKKLKEKAVTLLKGRKR
jgi:hypothetical protein